ncbi:MAG: class I adenylate-forming enzyme family protein, partial [Stellaceae bacterium]
YNQVSHLQFYCGVVGFFELLALGGRHRYLSTLPLYFSGGRMWVLSFLLRGDCVLLHGDLVNGRDFVQAVERMEATIAFVVPSLFRDLLATGGDKARLGRLERLVCGGAPLYPEEKRAAVRDLAPNFCEMYGAAESSVISMLRSADLEAHAGSVGQPHSLLELEVVDEGGRVLPAGESGLLRCRGPSLASPLAVPGSAPISGFRDGWYYPGENASLDDQGYIHLAGRSSELIMRGGAKIHPAEVEAVLQQHPDVVEAAVFGRRGANNEEEVIACVVGRGPLELSALVAHCRNYLAPTKRPQRIHILADLPKNASGKVDKKALATRLAGQD